MTTNGHDINGTVHSMKPGSADSLPVTSIISKFVASANENVLTSSVRSKLSDLILDMVGISAAAAHSSASTPAITAAITALNNGTGHCTAVTKGSKHPVHIAAQLNATYGHSLDFDDTHASSTLHPGVTAIWAAIAQAELKEASTDQFLLAVSVGYELTCRLGTELGYAAYSRGFHNTSTAGIFGAVASVAVLRKLSEDIVSMAFGLAGSRAAGSMQYLDNGSHNKRLHPGWAVRDAFECVALAEQGVIGATRILEGKMGFLNAYSPNPEQDLGRLVKGLGETWVFVETSLKPYPACRMTHGSIEAADIFAQKRRSHGAKDNKALIDEVESIEVRLRTANMSLVGDRTDNKVHPRAEVDGQ
jgi:2-methylcitrate dehydratase PrpD